MKIPHMMYSRYIAKAVDCCILLVSPTDGPLPFVSCFVCYLLRGDRVEMRRTNIHIVWSCCLSRLPCLFLWCLFVCLVLSRHIGSTGQCQDPGRVFKGKKMPGRMGNDRVTVQNLKILKVRQLRGNGSCVL